MCLRNTSKIGKKEVLNLSPLPLQSCEKSRLGTFTASECVDIEAAEACMGAIANIDVYNIRPYSMHVARGIASHHDEH